MDLAHSWYPSGCCSEGHCKPIDCSELIINGIEYIYKGMSAGGSKIYKSLDELCHVCVIPGLNYGWSDYISCIFIPYGIS